MSKQCLFFIFLLTFFLLADIGGSKSYGQAYFAEDWYESYINKGIKYLEQNRLDEARKQFMEAQRIVPDAPDAYINLATINILRNDMDGAIFLLEKAKNLMPYDYPQEHVILYNLGVCFYEKKDYKTAAKYYSEALEIKPDFVDAQEGLNLSSAQIKLAENRSFYINADEPISSPYEPYADIWEMPLPTKEAEDLSDEEKLQIELVYRNLKEGRRKAPPRIIPQSDQTAKSVPPIEVVKPVAPEQTAKNTQPAKTTARITPATTIKSVPPLGAGRESVPAFKVEGSEQETIELAKEYLKEGSISYGQGDTKEAIRKLNESIRLDPQNAQAYYLLGLIYAEKKDMKNAINAFNDAVKYNPDFTEAYLNLGGAYGVIGQYDQSLIALGEALRLDSGNPKIYFNMAMVYKSKGNNTEAKKYFAEAKKLALKENDSALIQKIEKYHK